MDKSIMKYAIVNTNTPRSRVQRISDTDPVSLEDGVISVEITDELGTTIQNANEPYFYVNSNFITRDQLPITDEMKSRKKKILAKLRWEAEFGGFTEPNSGMFVRTDERTRTLLNAAMLRINANPNYEMQNWKTADGNFITLQASTIVALDTAVEQFIASQFAKEASLVAQIDSATTMGELSAINW